MNVTCRIICDSTCDLTAQRARDLGVDVVPFHYAEPNRLVDGLNGDDDLFETRDAHEFYDAIRAGASPRTSQSSQGEYEQAFRDAVDAGQDAVFFSMSSGISGGFNGACLALERLRAELGELPVEIYVVDTLVASTPLTLFVEEACRRRDAGMSARELADWAEEARYRLHTIFMVDNLDALHRGGRVPKTVAVLGDTLDVKPLLHFNLDGTLGICGAAHGRKKGMKKLAAHFGKRFDPSVAGPVAAVGDADVPEEGDGLAGRLKEMRPDVVVHRPTIGPTIGCHVGAGMVSCCCWGADRRG